MSRMGKDGYSNAGTARMHVKTDEDLKEDFKKVCETMQKTMTEAINEYMSKEVEEHGMRRPAEGDEYYCPDPVDRELYEACLKFANEKLVITQRRDASRIAQETGLFTKDSLYEALVPLRKQGYVSLGPIPVDVPSKTVDHWMHWRVKPRTADPNVWKYREDR